MNVKQILKKSRTIVLIANLVRDIYRQFGMNIPLAGLQFARFLSDYSTYRNGKQNPNFDSSAEFLFPCLLDKTLTTPLDATYFFQDAWAARKLFQLKPGTHYDVGSSAKSLGILSQFVPVTMVDIRPIELELEGLSFRQGSILELPFESNSIESLSSLCVVEHIGLGRYGDPIDPWGTEKAVAELVRVLKNGGDLLVSLPVDRVSRVYFNAHRALSRDYVIALFHELTLLEEKYIYGRELCSAYQPDKGFGTGLFHFRK